jgi:hypothetical protein
MSTSLTSEIALSFNTWIFEIASTSIPSIKPDVYLPVFESWVFSILRARKYGAGGTYDRCVAIRNSSYLNPIREYTGDNEVKYIPGSFGLWRLRAGGLVSSFDQ